MLDRSCLQNNNNFELEMYKRHSPLRHSLSHLYAPPMLLPSIMRQPVLPTRR